MAAQRIKSRPRYANYWEDDTTANPVIVKLLHEKPKDDHYTVQLPDGQGRRQVHIHTLGVPHVA